MLAEVAISHERAEFIAGLRALATFLEERPDVKGTHEYYATNVNVYVQTREELAAIAKVGSWAKVPMGNYFSLRREFGPIGFEVFTDRENVCRKVTKGTRLVPAVEAHEEPIEEWVCDETSLIAEN